MVKDFSESEKKLREIISNSKSFTFEGEAFVPELVTKPTIEGGGGETKTDVYIKARKISDNSISEIKISYKQKNFSFLENKIKKERAEAIYGKNWLQVVSQQIEQIKERFAHQPLVYFEKSGNTRKGSIKLGWRYEMESYGKRTLGVSIKQNIAKQVLQNENAIKKYADGFVNGNIIPGSGMPDYFLTENISQIKNTDDIFQNLVSAKDMINKSKITAAFLAQNYDPFMDKQHGGNRRHLAVYVDWTAKNNKLSANLVFDKPLLIDSNQQYDKLLIALEKLGISVGKRFNLSKLEEKISPNVITSP